MVLMLKRRKVRNEQRKDNEDKLRKKTVRIRKSIMVLCGAMENGEGSPLVITKLIWKIANLREKGEKFVAVESFPYKMDGKTCFWIPLL